MRIFLTLCLSLALLNSGPCKLGDIEEHSGEPKKNDKNQGGGKGGHGSKPQKSIHDMTKEERAVESLESIKAGYGQIDGSVDYSNMDLPNRKFGGSSGSRLTPITFDENSDSESYSEFAKANFSKTNLSGSSFNSIHFTETNFEKADLTGVTFSAQERSSSVFMNPTFKGANLTNAQFTTVQLSFPKFDDQTNLKNTIFSDILLTGVSVVLPKNLSETKFINSRITNTLFNKNQIGKQTFSQVTFEYAKFIEVDLSGVDFSGSTFRNGTIFIGCNLKNAIFNNTKIEQGVAFDKVNLVPDPSNPGQNKVNTLDGGIDFIKNVLGATYDDDKQPVIITD